MIDVSKFTFKRILCHGRLYRIFCFDVQVLAFTDSVYLQDFGHLLWMIYWTTKVKWVDNVISILPAAQEIQQPVPGRSQASPTSTGARLMCFVLQDRSPNVPEHPIHSIGKPSLSSSNSYFTERNGHYSLRRSRPITMQIYGLGSECTQ